jgi:hypothetical protein
MLGDPLIEDQSAPHMAMPKLVLRANLRFSYAKFARK